jgi:hypothetical protein
MKNVCKKINNKIPDDTIQRVNKGLLDSYMYGVAFLC